MRGYRPLTLKVERPLTLKVESGRIKENSMKKIVIIIGFGVVMSACNVTRVVTNESKYTTRGDTSVVITTKTVETYDASKKL